MYRKLTLLLFIVLLTNCGGDSGSGPDLIFDVDGDGVEDNLDAFPQDSTESRDFDNDGIGDNADLDDDNDGLSDIHENNIGTNQFLKDTDGDGVLDGSDLFPLDSTEFLDFDLDGLGDNTDQDDDSDGVDDSLDAFPLDASETLDTDSDQIGDNTDIDDDGDGVLDIDDPFPLDRTETVDTDNDGIGNNADNDDDNDGIIDGLDAFPIDVFESNDSDGDGLGDNSDPFPFDPNETIDTDSDGIGDNADTDDDGDLVLDSDDAFPLDSTESIDTDNDGVGNNADLDDDGDGVLDANDAFPLDPARSSAWLDIEVIGASTNPKYSINLIEGIVLDYETNLIWLSCSLGQFWDASTQNCAGAANTYGWAEANAVQYDYAGFNNWRMPSIDELATIVYCSSGSPTYFQLARNDYCSGIYDQPTLVSKVFPEQNSTKFWSSTRHEIFYSFARIDFENGFLMYDGHISLYQARLVRENH